MKNSSDNTSKELEQLRQSNTELEAEVTRLKRELATLRTRHHSKAEGTIPSTWPEGDRTAAMLASEARVMLQIIEDAPLTDILHTLVLAVERLAEGMLGSILLLDEDGRTLRHGAAPSLPPEYNRRVDGLPIGPRVGSCGTAAYWKSPVIVADIATDPLWASYREVVELFGLRACWSTPLLSTGGRVLGTFAQYYREARVPTAAEGDLIARATQLATIAIERVLAKQELRRNTERFHLLLNHVRVIAWEGDCASRTFTYVSDQAESISGYPPKAWTTFGFWESHIHPDDRARAVQYRSERTSRGETQECEYRWLSPDGRLVWIRDTVVVEMADSGPRRLYGMMVDITESKKAQLALTESERRYRTLFEHASEALVVLDVDTSRFVDANDNAVRLFGLSREALSHRGPVEVSPPRQMDGRASGVAARDNIQQALAGLIPAFEWLHRNADGKDIPCEVRLVRLPAQDRHLIRGSVTDITERKKAQDNLRQERDFSNALIESLPGLAYLIDSQGKILRWNKYVESVTGYSSGEIAAMHPLDFVVPEERAKVAGEMQSTFELGANVTEVNILTRSGRRIPFVFSAMRIMREGAPFLIGLGIDITDRKLAEQNVRKERDFSDALIESLPGNFYLFTVAGRVLRWNRHVERITGYSAEEVAAMHALDFLAPEYREPIGQTIRETVISGQKLTEEADLLSKDGSRTPFLFTGLPLVLNGETCIIGLGIDITDRKKAEQEVRRLNVELEERVQQRTAQLAVANQELEAFSYSVSHDLRAPLRAMSGFCEILQRKHAAAFSAEAVHYLDRVQANAQKMGHLIDDLLAFSRLGRQPLRKQPVATADLVQQVMDDLQAEWKGRNVKTVIGALPVCQGDPALLKQVFVNLIGNALKYSKKRDPALIEIGCRQSVGASAPVYYVKDNGVGFDLKYSGKLFGVFQRLHRPEEYEGTGVGLAIVQRIVRRHGGCIWAEAAVDKGATFFFTLTESPADERLPRNSHPTG